MHTSFHVFPRELKIYIQSFFHAVYQSDVPQKHDILKS